MVLYEKKADVEIMTGANDTAAIAIVEAEAVDETDVDDDDEAGDDGNNYRSCKRWKFQNLAKMNLA